jgi:hypothetical protein
MVTIHSRLRYINKTSSVLQMNILFIVTKIKQDVGKLSNREQQSLLHLKVVESMIIQMKMKLPTP